MNGVDLPSFFVGILLGGIAVTLGYAIGALWLSRVPSIDDLVAEALAEGQHER
jgi:hypothetical protein